MDPSGRENKERKEEKELRGSEEKRKDMRGVARILDPVIAFYGKTSKRLRNGKDFPDAARCDPCYCSASFLFISLAPSPALPLTRGIKARCYGLGGRDAFERVKPRLCSSLCGTKSDAQRYGQE